ncbi:hypothetical protein E4U42_007900 [Claviceps africana]|uniref:Uncharacterized protein n=1 Tax=Claviceps africana TaxID=83212 RepID=A0A8K0J162_9HYPO|nr:hypothetical protein E4U42_007900 [Claviceps africana]
MLLSPSSLLGLGLLASAVTNAFPLDERASATPPTEDAFYSLPDNLAGASPGTILRHRKPPAPISAFRFDPQNLEGSHQILYRTTDNFGNATATVLTVLVPHNADYGKVVSHQMAEDAPNANCAPSYAMQLGSNDFGLFGTIVQQAELLLIDAYLAEGWVVVVPDHQGPRGEFLANQQGGYTVLDGVRAALASTSLTGIRADAAVALFGYSGGSLVSGFAAEQQPSYAPELKLAGAVLGANVPQLLSAFDAMNKGPFSGLIPAGIGGLSIAYPAIGQLVQDQLLPQYKTKFNQARNQCSGTIILENTFTDYFAQVRNPNIFRTEPVLSVINANSQGQHVPRVPLFVYKAIHDEVSPVADTDALVRFYCDGGASVEYVRDEVSTHATLAITGPTFVLPWLRRVLRGEHVADGKCSTRTVITTLADSSTAGLPKFLSSALRALLGRPIGPAGVLRG